MNNSYGSGLFRWLVFAGILAAGIIFTPSTKTYASSGMFLQKTDHRIMQQDTGMTHRTHGGMKGRMGDMKGMMGEMHDSMKNVRMTGNPDVDFPAMMIEHHKGAIRMSENEINKGKDQKVISMAKTIIKDQQNELQDLQKFVKTDSAKSGMAMKSDTSMHRKRMGEETGSARQHTMMNRMQKMHMTGDQDKDYVSMMVMHHQHAIDMANAYLEKGKNEELIKLAKDMIKTNESQIKDLENWEMEKAK